MQVNLRTTNFNYGIQNNPMNNRMQNSAQKPVRNEGLTASVYFGNKGIGTTLLAALGLTALFGACTKEDELYTYGKAEAYAYANDTTIVNTHAKGCNCDSCRQGRDTVYVDKDHIVYVDTGSYHVSHDTIVKWMLDYQKPIPLDSIAKDLKKFGADSLFEENRENVVHYEATREWEYGNKFVADMNQLESSKYTLVYDREDLNWKGEHIGWGKDVFRIPDPKVNFTITTYDGKEITNPKGYFVETYVNEADQNESINSPDRKLVSRQFLQTRGDSVLVYTYDPETKLYREDGRVSAGYLNGIEKGGNVLLTDLIASDTDKQFSRDPEYLTEDHLTNVKVVTVNDEELKLLCLRAKDDKYAEKNYGVKEGRQAWDVW